MYSRSNAAYLKSSIDRRKLLFPLNITDCLPPFPTAPTNSFIDKSLLESDSVPKPFRFDISVVFVVVISVGDRLSVITVSYCRSLQCPTVGHCSVLLSVIVMMSCRRSLCITFDEQPPPFFPISRGIFNL